MSEHQARLARDDVYDHEHDQSEAVTSAPRESGSSGRRRRPVADWGVGDDVFEHMPRGRFSRASEGPPRERRFASHDGSGHRPAEPAAGGETTAEHRPAEPAERPGDGRRTIVIDRPDDVPSEIAAIAADRHRGEDEEPPSAELPPTPAGERRTVRIAGRPEGSLEAARFHREHGSRRPPRTAQERIGARPDRLAMWAFALGMLLILIAVLTAG